MAAATGMRKSTSSINDYPEHLNPFREDDNHNKIRFWTLSRKPGRSNSFSLNNLKDFRNTWSLKSFMKKNKRGQVSESDKAKPVNGETSPVVYRRPIHYGERSSPEGAPAAAAGPQQDRYVYGGSVTPLPRSRFQERMRSTPPPATATTADTNTPPFRHMAPGRASYSHRSGEPYALPGLALALARSECGGSRASVESANPFEEEDGAGAGPCPVPARRKKKRLAPLPPHHPAALTQTSLTTSHSSPDPVAVEVKKKEDIDELNDDPSLKIELKIEEDLEAETCTDNDVQLSNRITNEITKEAADAKIEQNTKVVEVLPETVKATEIIDTLNNNNEECSSDTSPVEMRNKQQNSTDSDDNDVVFKKVNIREYRRNSSFNSDSINLNSSNTELSPLNNKRCKSLSNTMNSNNNSFTAYNVTLHIDEDTNEVKDVNDNQPAPKKVVCKLFDTRKARRTSIDNSISSTEKEFMEIDRATRELEQEIHRLNSSVKYMDDHVRKSNGTSVSEIKSRFENPMYSPNPIPKPRRSRAGSTSPVSPRKD